MTKPTKAMRVEENDSLEAVQPTANPNTGIGGNFPPLKEFFAELNQNLPAQLDADTAELIKRVQDLLDAETRMWVKIGGTHLADGDEENAAKVIAFQGQVQKCIKDAEAVRVGLNEGPLAAQRIIMGHFRTAVYAKMGETTSDKQGKRGGLFDRVSDVLTNYQQRKADNERRILQEEQRKAREAQEAADRAQREAERIEREAAQAEQRRKAEEERKIREAEEARLAKITNERQLKAELDRQEKARVEREERAAREQEEQAQRAESTRLAAEEAERKRQEAEQAAAAAAAKTSALSRTGGLHGSSASLRKNWKARVSDHEALKADPKAMAMVWEYLKPDAIEDAVNRMAKLKENTVKVAGVEFYDASRSAVRA